MNKVLYEELIIAFLMERFKRATLRNSYSNLLKDIIIVFFLLIKGYEKCALQIESAIAPFVERFKTTTLVLSCRCLQECLFYRKNEKIVSSISCGVRKHSQNMKKRIMLV